MRPRASKQKPSMARSSGSAGADHRVRMPPDHSGGEKVMAATPEKQLNGYVRFLAMIERLGNALGTLAFTWATVVLLGGYPTVLHRGWNDFWFATIIVFLEALRMFSRDNRLDYQLFFRTRGAVRPLERGRLIIIVILSIVVNYMILLAEMVPLISRVLIIVRLVIALVVPFALGILLSSGALKLLCKQLRRRYAISLWSPLVTVLFLVPLIVMSKNTMVKWIIFIILFLALLLLTISRLHFTRIIELAEHAAQGNRRVFWHQCILNLCMLVELGMLVSFRPMMLAYVLYASVFLSLGNFQIPAAVARVVLALLRLIQHNYYGDEADNPSKTNLAPSLNIFYGMVLGQGMLYVVACVLDFFSFIPRKSLARRGGLSGQWGLESVNLYYAYAWKKSMDGDVLAPKTISLANFAMDFLNSDTPKMQLHGIRIMHNLLKHEATRKHLFWKLTTSTKTMARVIEMLDWSSPKDTAIRLFAAKVTVELATSHRAITAPSTIQVVSGLLNYGNQHKRGNPLLDGGVEYEILHDRVLTADDNQEERLNAIPDTGSLLETQDFSTHQVGTMERVSEFWSVSQEDPLTEKDVLPILGMSILEGLASCDQDNCVEINRASGLISKIIRFTSYNKSDHIYTDSQQKILLTSSLKLLHRLTSIDEEIGITLRHKISKHPFLLRNLAEILGDSTSSQESRKFVVGILRNLAIDSNTSKEIGSIQVIITRLMHAFVIPDNPSSTNVNWLLRKVAGQALAMLAMDNANNCLTMLRETGYVFVKELTSMIHVDRYRCVAASLLRSICLQAQSELQESDLKELSYALREVLERILVADTAELDIFIGLSSQVCRVIPRDFVRELEDGQIKERFVKRLVDVLNANMEPTADYPGIRRVILEQAINMMEYDSHYTSCFNDRRMAEALSMVEQTISEAENYNIFLGDTGLKEANEPLSTVVARAKKLLTVR